MIAFKISSVGSISAGVLVDVVSLLAERTLLTNALLARSYEEKQ